MYFSNFIQGAHQSEPAKTRTMGLFSSTEQLRAWAYEGFQSCAKVQTAYRNKNIEANIFSVL